MRPLAKRRARDENFAVGSRVGPATGDEVQAQSRRRASAVLDIISGSLIALAASSVWAPSAWAQASATVRLVGHIPPQATISLGAAGVSSTVVSLDLTHPNGTINLLNFTNNSNGGESYNISISSDNLAADGTPQLVSADGTAAAVPFQLVYNGQPLQFANGVAVLNSIGGDNLGSGNGALGLVPLGQAGNGNYTDTLVFNITAK